MPEPKFHVAVWYAAVDRFNYLCLQLDPSGGGIGGLCLAVALSRYPDIQVNLYEAAAQFKEIGAGVMIWSRTWEILTLLGLGSKFAEVAHAPPDDSVGANPTMLMKD